MRILNALLFGSMLIAGSASADGFGFNLGPFDMQFGIGNNGYSNGGYVIEHHSILDNPICEAISNQLQLGFTVEGKEVVNAKEIKIVTKRLIVEPYAFGVTRDGKPVLRGKVVADKLLKEITVKYGEERFEEPQKEKGISGWFHSSDKKDIDIQNISDVQVLANTRFDVPKDFEGMKDDNVRVICQLPVKSNK